MGYDRRYEPEEVHQMLYLSERRLRPTAPANRAQPGHAISQHSEQRDDLFDRRGEVAQDSSFVSRKDLVLACHEALNATAGQRELAKLNGHGRGSNRCVIVFQLSATKGKIKADVVKYPMAEVDGDKVPAQGPAYYVEGAEVNSIVMVIDKLHAAEAFAPLHIQTAYPKDVKF